MMHIRATPTTGEVLQEIGERLRGYRLQQNRTLDEVATAAGVGLRTAQRAEAGQRPTLATLVKLLRALGRLEALDAFLPPPLVSPLQMAQLAGKVRQRARHSQRSHRNAPGDRSSKRDAKREESRD